MTIAVSLLGLGFLIFVHELGHFVASLALRMRPRKFYIGFPPALVKRTRKGIEYGIGMVPLGGFVKIPGMHRPAPADVDVAFGAAVAEIPELARPSERLRRALAGADHDAARDAVRSLSELTAGKGLSQSARRSVDRGLADIEDALGPDAYWRAATWKRVLVIFAGPAANILLAIVLFAGLFMTSGGKATTTIDTVASGSPAAAIGLRPGDRIIAIDGAQMKPGDIARTISSSKGKPLTLVVERAGSRLTLGPGAARPSDGAYRLGFVLRGEGLSPGESVREAFRVTGIVSRDIAGSLGRLVTGSGRESVSSPVGIVQGSSDAAKQGTDSFLWVLGLISLSIALLNLLPLLPLDGGHIAFSVVEGVRGRAVRREIYERVSIVGIGLVLVLFFIGLSNDIGRLS
ncbi:Peptidase family M50 [Gaiella occulta]|uniref:Peptidase family M50 n=1 Tax=Gaiella occulta TaxID=1002870 RepID=A0A7M2YZ84_9ACTN|nr:M50 family metallopeptidase [Gaiella occulta]RDI75178.1 Peptidase family M50 [Gaiella occulta]